MRIMSLFFIMLFLLVYLAVFSLCVATVMGSNVAECIQKQTKVYGRYKLPPVEREICMEYKK